MPFYLLPEIFSHVTNHTQNILDRKNSSLSLLSHIDTILSCTPPPILHVPGSCRNQQANVPTTAGSSSLDQPYTDTDDKMVFSFPVYHFNMPQQNVSLHRINSNYWFPNFVVRSLECEEQMLCHLK